MALVNCEHVFHRDKVQYVAAEKAGLAYMGAMLQLIGGEHAHQLRAVLEQPSHPDPAATLSAVVADETGEEEQAANDVHRQAAVARTCRYGWLSSTSRYVCGGTQVCLLAITNAMIVDFRQAII
jgi:tryptophan 2,3-dioxygenase